MRGSVPACLWNQAVASKRKLVTHKCGVLMRWFSDLLETPHLFVSASSSRMLKKANQTTESLCLRVSVVKTSFSAACYVCGTASVTRAGIGVNILPVGTERTGHGELRTTRSISEPRTGVPPNIER
jgi:hypothetical protein